MIDLKSMKLILASGSARRKEIFEAHGFTPVIMPMDVDETLPEGITPQDAVMYLSLKKGLACREVLKTQSASIANANDPSCTDKGTFSNREHALIVSADTIVYAKDITTGKWTIMGKPKDEDDAWRMLRSIASTSHKVMTGVTLISYTPASDADTVAGADSVIDPDPVSERNIFRTFYDSTDVYVKPLSDEEIKAYIDSGEPFGKAGGYAIQMAFGKYIDHIEGDYENVVGFPYNHMTKEIEAL